MKRNILARRAASAALAACMMFTLSAPGSGRKHRCPAPAEHRRQKRGERAGRKERYIDDWQQLV